MQQGQNKGHCSSSPTHWLLEWLKWQVNKFRRSCTEKCNFTWTPRCSNIERKIRQVRTLDLVTSIRMTSWAEGIMTQGITVQWLNLSGPKLAFKNSHSLFLFLLLNKDYDLVGVLLGPPFLSGPETGTVGVGRSGESSLWALPQLLPPLPAFRPSAASLREYFWLETENLI